MADRGRPFSSAQRYTQALPKQFSRPMTGHTPQKLPAFAAISCIIALRAFSFWKNPQIPPTRARTVYHPLQHLSSIFSEKITNLPIFFRTLCRIYFSQQTDICPLPAHIVIANQLA